MQQQASPQTTQADLRAEERKSAFALVLITTVGVGWLAVRRVKSAMPHISGHALVLYSFLLLLSWAAPAAVVGTGFLLARWERRQRPAWRNAGAHRHLQPNYERWEGGDGVAVWKRIEVYLARFLRTLHAKNPFYLVIALISLAAIIDLLLAKVATDAPMLAGVLDIFGILIDGVVMIGGAIYTKRLITSGSTKRPPRSVAALARRLQPPESGALVNPQDLGIPAPSQKAPAIAVIGPSGTGKTHLLASLIACWPGPVFFTTTKPDLALYVAVSKKLQAEWTGENPQAAAQIYDPAGLLADHWARRSWNPSVVPTGSSPDLHAAEMARVMAEELQGGQANPYWRLRAEPIIAILLALAALRGNDLASLIRELQEAGPEQLVTLVADGAAQLGKAGDTANANALAGLQASLVNDATSRRAYDELASTLATLQPLRRIQATAVANAHLPKLDLGEWVHGKGAAGIVVSPTVGASLGPLIGAFVENAIEQLRATQGSRKWAALIVLDEVANVASLPMLGTWTTELRGWGAYIVVAGQSSEQFRKWDHYDPTSFITHHFPLTLVAQGAAEHQLARLVSERHGTHIVTQDAQFANPWRERVPVIAPEHVFGAYEGPGHWVAIYNGLRAGDYALQSVDALLDQLQNAIQHRKELQQRRATLSSTRRIGLKRGILP